MLVLLILVVTTSIAVYDEGDLQFTAVLPYGGVNITNDLAIGLKTAK